MADNHVEPEREIIPIEYDLPIQCEEIKHEKIEIYERKSSRLFLLARLWKYLTLVTAFAAILICAYYFSDIDVEPEENSTVCHDDATTAFPEDSDTLSSSVQPENIPLLIVDESMLDLDINEYKGANYLSGSFISEDFKVVIVHSHSSEYISENISVIDAGNAISQLLSSAGIDTLHCEELFDSEGRVGAYNRMKKMILDISSEYAGKMLVIDLHGSDSGAPVTFTVGTDSAFGWQENLRCVVALTEELRNTETALRLLPGSLGQDSGIITINVGICGKECTDIMARSKVAALVNAILNLYSENPREQSGDF